MTYFVIGLCCGLVVMAVICEKAHKAEVNELKKKIEKDSKYHYESVAKLEEQIKDMRNVIKSLNEDNVRLRKKISKKNKTNIENC